ncbi:putative phenol 2-monooxygenase [Mollisia scopiformis]|uniref:Putative phenol 2-monooxygenase n=1 Tax=Mollisia scopiformis TaxID=149040 RepID=A0A132B2V2_MOLSC|nr:putative phenol 2-monooxygenase [Mollisia scopiformis]KUJ06726.1 putative phenol 2-monooxygenase [Mollisia scopiformis]
MSEKVDVLICGSGSAGLCTATWLARYGVRCKIVDSRLGPLVSGQADGVQCRTVEIFESFGLEDRLLRDAYHVLEVCFWSANSGGEMVRTRRVTDTPEGLSHQPHVILNQARVHGILINAMRDFNQQEVEYGYTVKSVQVDSAAATGPDAHCVMVVVSKGGKDERIDAKYVLGCDGAHSTVRRSLGVSMIGDSTDAVWGVMDVFPRTNFPDIRKKVVIQTPKGSMLVIPREGGSMVRFYIELGRAVAPKEVKLDDLQATARHILAPFTLDIASTFWWSAYSIGQRLADQFSKHNRVFLTGDACHTHSPKAGQGMNVSLQDGYNIGWKLATILKGHASTDLLYTYNLEREKVAATLIDFDRAFTKSFSTKTPDDEPFDEHFVRASMYTAGLTATYDESPITSVSRSAPHLARNITVGMRFPSTLVTRRCDARVIQLVRAMPADSRWRIVLFAGNIQEVTQARKLQQLGESLFSRTGLLHTYTPVDADIDSFIEILVVLSGMRHEIDDVEIPLLFSPVTGKWGMCDVHKIFVDEINDLGHSPAYNFYGVDRNEGAAVIVRPDHCKSLSGALLLSSFELLLLTGIDVSMVTARDDYDGLKGFFDGWATPQM